MHFWETVVSNLVSKQTSNHMAFVIFLSPLPIPLKLVERNVIQMAHLEMIIPHSLTLCLSNKSRDASGNPERLGQAQVNDNSNTSRERLMK